MVLMPPVMTKMVERVTEYIEPEKKRRNRKTTSCNYFGRESALVDRKVTQIGLDVIAKKA